jgi:hypothetical protein
MKKIIGILAVSVLLLTSCNKEEVEVNTLPSSAEGVQNSIDELSIGFANFNDVSDSRSYNYTNTGPNADLSVGGFITGGQVEVTIKNDAGTQLFKQTYTNASGTNIQLSDPSTSWTIKVDFANASGQLGISLDKID